MQHLLADLQRILLFRRQIPDRISEEGLDVGLAVGQGRGLGVAFDIFEVVRDFTVFKLGCEDDGVVGVLGRRGDGRTENRDLGLDDHVGRRGSEGYSVQGAGGKGCNHGAAISFFPCGICRLGLVVDHLTQIEVVAIRRGLLCCVVSAAGDGGGTLRRCGRVGPLVELDGLDQFLGAVRRRRPVKLDGLDQFLGSVRGRRTVEFDGLDQFLCPVGS